MAGRRRGQIQARGGGAWLPGEVASANGGPPRGCPALVLGGRRDGGHQGWCLTVNPFRNWTLFRAQCPKQRFPRRGQEVDS